MPDILKQKVAIYIRVSTAMQIDKDSLQVQRRELIAYANMVLNIDEYEVFEDPGFSAKNTDHPAYQIMMARLRTGEFSHLLVWKIDRISRNLLDFTAMYSELKDLGVTFISKYERFDTSSAIGEAMLKIILVFAELERQMTAERVTAVMLSRANNGQWNGGRIPYGYDYDKQTKTFSINQDEAKVILLAYDLYEAKQSILYVSRHFNEIGLKTRAGNSWSATTVYGLLTNKFNTGVYVYNSHQRGRVRGEDDESEWIKIENHHPAIIDDVRYDRMQYVLQRNRRGGTKPGDTYIKKNVHIFGGLCRCGLCNGNMAANLDRRRANGWRPSQYSCVNKRNDTAKCNSKYVSDITLGPFVFSYLANILCITDSLANRLNTKTLQNRLLVGDPFIDVAYIDKVGLNELLAILKEGKTGLEYRPSSRPAEDATVADERAMLNDRRQRGETALKRLQALYLYGDSGMSEKDYLLEREKILTDVKKSRGSACRTDKGRCQCTYANGRHDPEGKLFPDGREPSQFAYNGLRKKWSVTSIPKCHKAFFDRRWTTSKSRMARLPQYNLNTAARTDSYTKTRMHKILVCLCMDTNHVIASMDDVFYQHRVDSKH